MSQRRVVITGLGVVSSIGTGRQEFWEALCQQRVGISKIDAFDASAFACRVGGQIRDFKINDYIPKSYRKAAKLMAKDIELSVGAADLAVRDAGLVTKGIDPDHPQVDPARLGANVGAGLIDIDLDEMGAAVHESLDDNGRFSYPRWGKSGITHLTPLWLLKFLPNMLACHIGIIHDAQGPSNTILCGEISTLQAVGEAFHTVAYGQADVCICGGAKSKIPPLSLIRWELMGRLNTTCNDRPEKACLPFDVNRAGCVPSESAGIFILEALEHAKARGAKIYAEMVAVAATRQGRTHQLEPCPEGLARAISNALRFAEYEPQDVDLVIPHGVGGVAEDLAEAKGIRLGLGEEKGRSVPVLPIKGGVGNSDAASGGLELAAAVMAISTGTIPATTNCPQPCPKCGLNIVQEDRKAENPDVVLLTGYTIGGQSAVMVVKRFVE